MVVVVVVGTAGTVPVPVLGRAETQRMAAGGGAQRSAQ